VSRAADEPSASAWPVAVAGGVAGLYGTVGLALLGATGPALAVLVAGAALLLVGLVGWLRQGPADRAPAPTGIATARTTTLLFVCVEVATFGAGLATYGWTLAGSAVAWRVLPATPGRVAAATLLLVTSGFTVHDAVVAADRGDARRLATQLRLTLALGALFLVGLAGDYYELAGSGVTGHSFLDAYLALTGLHGLHVLGGLVAVGVALVRTDGTSTAGRRPRLVAVSLYWYAVVGGWLVLAAALAVGPLLSH